MIRMPKSRKTKIGGLSLAMTVAVIAAVIVFNAVFRTVAESLLWYVDMTEKQVYSLSDECKSILREVTSEVNIYFTQKPEDLMSGSNSSQYMKYIYTTALQLEKEFSNISVECVDVIENPGFFEYYYNTAASKILTTNVIVESGGEFRLLASDAFFTWDENYEYIWGYDGEAKFASTILQVTESEMPSVCLTTGHGEPSADDSAQLRFLFETAGFEVIDVDLSKENLPDSARIVVINDPVYDFTGIESGAERNEIDKIDDFVDDHGCLMAFVDSEKAGDLTNLSEFLSEWGIEFNPGQTVNDKLNSISQDGNAVVAEYGEENSLGASLYTDITSLSSNPKAVFNGAMPLTVTMEDKTDLTGTKVASPVFYCPASADTVENGSAVESGKKPLAVLTRESTIKDNDYFYSYVFVSGCPDFVSDKYLSSTAYINRDVIVNTARLIGKEKIVADIEMKVLDNTDLDITAAQANRLSIVMMVTLPAIIAVWGVAVNIRRRRK